MLVAFWGVFQSMLALDLSKDEFKTACFHLGATHLVPIFPVCILVMVSSPVCLNDATSVKAYVCLCFIYAHTKSLMGSMFLSIFLN